jgi:hypothetical protein
MVLESVIAGIVCNTLSAQSRDTFGFLKHATQLIQRLNIALVCCAPHHPAARSPEGGA